MYEPLCYADGSIHVGCAVLEHTVGMYGCGDVTKAIVGMDDQVVPLGRIQRKRTVKVRFIRDRSASYLRPRAIDTSNNPLLKLASS